MVSTKSRSASRPNADEKRKPNQPRYQPVEQADDEEIAQSQRQGNLTNPADNVPRAKNAEGVRTAETVHPATTTAPSRQ
jgi:hypothetical protein